ncbi:MAG: hypothetical protein SVW02_00950 [Candidatus Nanohaloarchaea archaeon]|nr:hypothetical protein [Candidatus Nanohaloarchaea archaeon]
MRGRSVTTLQAGIRSRMVEGAVRLLPLAQSTPLTKWMAVSLMAVERLDGRRF